MSPRTSRGRDRHHPGWRQTAPRSPTSVSLNTWHYRHPPRLGTRLKARQVDQPAAVIAIAWKAQQRLHHIWRRLDTKRGKRKTIVAAAVVRHLVGFCWAIVTTDTDEQPD